MIKSTIVAAAALLILAAACTTEKIVYVLPDGTEVTPTPTSEAQTPAETSGSQPTAAAMQPTPQTAPKSTDSQPTQPPVVNQRWHDKRNDLCSSLGLDAALCENIILNQTEPDGETQDIDLPDEPDATPVPVDDVSDAVDELQDIVRQDGEVSIQVLTYTESLIQQATDAVVQAEQELANQEATAAYLDAKKQELQELRQTYARLLERIGIAPDRSLALAEQIEQEYLRFSIERANGEALIRYKDARLAHTNALAKAEKNAIAQIESIAAANELASANENEADVVALSPLYAARDKAQTRYEEAVKEFQKQVQEYERGWLAAYEYYIADRDSKPEFPTYKGSGYNYYTNADDAIQRSDMLELITGITSIREQGKSRKDVNLILLQKDLSDAERAVVRAIAGNEKAQSEVTVYNEEASTIGIAVTNARLAVEEAYREHGVSEGQAGAIFRFTDSGKRPVIYNLSLVALNRLADANLADFKSALVGIVDTMNKDIQAANAARVSALSEAEDARYASADTNSQERQAEDEWEKIENLRRRIIIFDFVIMMVGWGIDGPGYSVPGIACRFDQDGYRNAAGTGRDAYVRKYWHKQQPLDRTYTKERLDAVTTVLDNLENWLQDRINYWETQGRDGFNRLRACESALPTDVRQITVEETTPIPD